MIIGAFVESLIRITANKQYAFILNCPNDIVGFIHLYGLGDPDNETCFSAFKRKLNGLSNSIRNTSKSG